jgi:uncharacterized protein
VPKEKKELEFFNMPLTLESVLEIKEDGGNYGHIKGYAAGYGNVDQANDVIEPGACAKFLKDNGPKVPILADHVPWEEIGINLEATEMQKGLKIFGQINLSVQKGLEKYALAKQKQEQGAKAGLSIGFNTLREEFNKETGIRSIKEIKLWEYSLVTWPCNLSARVDSVKFEQIFADKKFLESFIKELRSQGYSLQTSNERTFKRHRRSF